MKQIWIISKHYLSTLITSGFAFHFHFFFPFTKSKYNCFRCPFMMWNRTHLLEHRKFVLGNIPQENGLSLQGSPSNSPSFAVSSGASWPVPCWRVEWICLAQITTVTVIILLQQLSPKQKTLFHSNIYFSMDLRIY